MFHYDNILTSGIGAQPTGRGSLRKYRSVHQTTNWWCQLNMPMMFSTGKRFLS